MKISFVSMTLVLAALVSSADSGSTSALTQAPAASARAVDDPPPEPASCPLCGGDAGLHARVVIGIEGLQAKLLAYSMRW